MRNKVIATARQNYGGRWFDRGEEIETRTEQDAEDLVALKFAQWVERKNGKRYQRRDMRADE